MYAHTRTVTGLDLTPQTLPKFDGNPTKWLNFRDTFVRLVHDDKTLYPLAKLNALANSLVGSAAFVLDVLPICVGNFEVGWGLVMTEYNKPRVIRDALMKVIFELKPLTSENTPSLRYIITKFKMVTRQLTLLGINVAACDKILSYHLCRLLDSSTRRSWELHNTNDENVTLNDLLSFLDRRITGLLMALPSSSGRHSTPPSTQPSRPAPPRLVNQFYSGEICRCCKNTPHNLESCPDFNKLNPYVRCQKVKKLKACFGCLSFAHTLETCTAPVCTHCPHNKVHHRLLCFKYCDDQKQRSLNVGFIGAEYEQVEIDADESALLGTALVSVRANNGEVLPARALCDSGSQANVISEECVRRLRLPRTASNVSLSPVRAASRINSRGMVQLCITPNNGASQFKLIVNALVVPRVATVSPPTKENIGDWPSHVTQNLADPLLHEAGRIDILLGANVWSRILMASIHSNNSINLTAQLTRLGWVMFGGLQAPPNSIVGLVEAHEPSNAD